jgi:hypothetical protein
VGAELALAEHHGLSCALAALEQPKPLRSPSAARFWYESHERRETLGQGAYFPDTLTIDTQGLRMGPNFLRRLDGLQLLLTDLSLRIARNVPALVQNPRVGVVMTNAMGGEKALVLGRRCTALMRHGQTPEPGSEMTLEAIASALPTMCSGYPAYHLDLRGFHETWTGAPGTLFTSLALAPHWLDSGLSHVLVGAAHMLKSPLDVDEANALRGTREAPEAEGAGLFLLTTPEGAAARNEAVLGLVHAIVPGGDACTLDAACDAARLERGRVSRVDVCQLDASLEPQRESTQAMLGFLHEAVGVECLARALAHEPGLTAIQVQSGQELVCTVFVERTGELPAASLARSPLEVTLGKSPGPQTLQAAKSAQSTPLELRESIGPRLDEAQFKSWLTSTQAVMHAYFLAQRAVAEKLGHASAGRDLTLTGLRTPVHLVIREARASADGVMAATLRVDDSHPFYFDHPLDHLPGILLVEALQQLCEAALLELVPHALELRFLRFCEKHEPTHLTLTPESTGCYAVRFEQAGRAVASGRVRCTTLPSAIEAPKTSAAAPERDLGLLHKQRAENVLVTPLVPTTAGGARCQALIPPQGHALADGARGAWSLTYLLEVARQALMLAAHGVLGIPQGKPMNLLAVAVQAESALPRALAPMLELSPMRPVSSNEQLIADVPIAVRTGMASALTVRLKAQVVDRHTYQEQRWTP